MRARLIRVACAVVVLFVSNNMSTADGATFQSVASASISEINMRKAAKVRVTPEFPPEALAAKKTGVAVAAVLIDRTGAVASVRVLQAPHESIERSVLDAVRRWKFGVIRAGRRGSEGPIEVETKLTFYFLIDAKGKGSVTEPSVELPTQGAATFQEVPEAEVSAWLRKPRSVLLDLRPREEFGIGHASGAINIPSDEIAGRLSELATYGAILIDCRRSDPRLCRMMGPEIARLASAVVGIVFGSGR